LKQERTNDGSREPRNSIIFLDFDGVVVTTRSLIGRVTPDGFDPVAVKWIQMLLDSTGSELVISISWRSNYDRRGMSELLIKNGFNKPSLHSDWATLSLGRDRQAEIDDWLQRNGPRGNWLVLDDGIGLRDDLEHFVQTCTDNGIGFLDMLRCCRILRVNPDAWIKQAGIRLSSADRKLLGI